MTTGMHKTVSDHEGRGTIVFLQIAGIHVVVQKTSN